MRQSMLILGGSIIIIGSLLVKVVVAQHDGIISEDLYENEHVIPPHEHYQYTTPPCCKNPSVDTANYFVVSTMDGKLVALDVDKGGETVWETLVEGSPLLSGTLGRMKPILADGRHFSLIPVLDGSLYMYSLEDRLLESIPLNTDMLLQASVRIGHDAVAGGKTVSTTGIDPLTGKVRYHCSSAMCDSNETGVVSSTLVFRKSTNAVRAVDALTGTERWNLSVSEFDASLVLNQDDSSNLARASARSSVRLLVQPPEGIVTAIDSCGNQLWSRQLESHIAKTWRMEAAELTEVSLFNSENIHTLATADDRQDTEMQAGEESLFYIGTLNSEPFIMHSGTAKNELRRLARLNQEFSETTHSPGSQMMKSPQSMFFVQDRTIDDLLSVSFRNSYSSQYSADSGKQVAIPQSKHMQVVNRENRGPSSSSSCPKGEGISLLGDKYIKNAAFDRGVTNGNQGWFVMQPPTTNGRPRLIGMIKPSQCAASIMRKVEEKLDTWWKMTLGLLSVVFLTGLATVGLVRTRRPRAIVNLPEVATVQEVTAPVKKTAESRSTSCGPSVNGSTGTAPPSPPTMVTRERRTTSSNNSSCDPFHSKFLLDFEPVKLLGHGGFGVVFKAKNRLDEGFYAVKRIAVANNEVAIQRVLREVRAMARLDHHGIIRYYHTWIEKPPAGWQEETDQGMLAGMKSKKKQLNVGMDENKENLPEPVSIASTENDSVQSLPSPILANEDDSCGSWLDDPDDPKMTSRKYNSSSDESDTESDSYETDSKRPMAPKAPAEDSLNIVFESDGSKSDRSKSSKSSKEISQLGTQMVLVTSVDEDVLPSTNTHNYVYLYIQMQLCQERTLYWWLSHHKSPQDRPLNKMKRWLDQMTSAVCYIHGQGLIHRDIKPQNIFFSADDNLKIGDLGLVTKCVSAEEQPIEKSTRRSSSIHTDNVGTRGYMSPEQLENRPYTYKVDVFSLGLIFCEMVVPFQTLMERSRTLGDLQRGAEPDVLKGCKEDDREMIKWMTHLDPEQRPSCEEILQSDYLVDCYQSFEDTSSPVTRRRFRIERCA